jgi:hypothetical protein
MPRYAKRLSDVVVQQARHKQTRYEISDGGSGLVLRVEARPSAVKTWQVRFRTSAGRQRRMALGEFPAVGLANARAKAAQVRAEVRAGRDPATADQIQSPPGASSVGALIDKFRRQHFSQLSPKTAKDYERYLERDIRPTWGNRKISEIKRSDVSTLVQQVADRARNSGGTGVAGAMLRRVLGKLFNCAVAWGLLDHSPVVGTMPPAKVAKRGTRLAVSDTDGGRDIVGTMRQFLVALHSTPLRPETRVAVLLCLILGLRARRQLHCAAIKSTLKLGSSISSAREIRNGHCQCRPLLPRSLGVDSASWGRTPSGCFHRSLSQTGQSQRAASPMPFARSLERRDSKSYGCTTYGELQRRVCGPWAPTETSSSRSSGTPATT